MNHLEAQVFDHEPKPLVLLGQWRFGLTVHRRRDQRRFVLRQSEYLGVNHNQTTWRSYVRVSKT